MKNEALVKNGIFHGFALPAKTGIRLYQSSPLRDSTRAFAGVTAAKTFHGIIKNHRGEEKISQKREIFSAGGRRLVSVRMHIEPEGVRENA